MYTHPGTKLLFMGGEFGQTSEWDIEKGLEWWLLDHAPHQGIQNWVKALNKYYKEQKALFEKQFSNEGFAWIDHGDADNSYLSYIRKGEDEDKPIVIICNFTPLNKWPYRLGVPKGGVWKEVINSDASEFGGSGQHRNDTHLAVEEEWSNQPFYIEIGLSPLSIMIFERQ